MKMKTTLLTTLVLTLTLALLLESSALAQAERESRNPPPVSDALAQNPRSPRDAEDAPAFFFPGGTPRQLLDAVEKQYKVDWSSVAQIPNEMNSVNIPALRITQESLKHILNSPGRGGRFGGGGAAGRSAEAGGADQEESSPKARSLQAVVALYNSLQVAKPELGWLMVQGDLAKPSVVLFTPSRQASPTADFKMRAYPLKGTPEKDWQKLSMVIVEEVHNLASAQAAPRTSVKDGDIRVSLHRDDPIRDDPVLVGEWVLVANEGDIRVSLHHDTALLVVLGPGQLLEAVDSIVSAWHINQEQAETKPAAAK